MLQDSAVSALRVDDQDFLVRSTIDRCPKVMMIRELFKNALESAQQAADGRVIFSVSIESAPKLAIWNNGPGMDDEELGRMTNLAASIGKVKGLDKNFGMGAKVASLPSNRRGIRYRSCKSGRVHETILCERDGVYGRLRRFDSTGATLGDVIDVTQTLTAEGGHSLEQDWTEVVLLGNSAEQNTVVDPYDSDPPQKIFWLATYLYHRFYRLPENVEVRLMEGTHARKSGSRRFETISMRREKGVFSQHETIELGSGIKIHYIYDEAMSGSGHNRSVSGSIASDLSTCAVVFQGEMYSVLNGRSWTIDAPTFGIPFGARHISIHIELPDHYPVLPEGYRQFLRYGNGEQDQVEAKQFALQVLENRPEWMIDLIHSMAPNSGDSSDEIRSRLQDLLNRLRIRAITPRVHSEGDLDVEQGTGRAASDGGSGRGGGGNRGQHKPDDLTVVQTGAQMARMAQNLERAPRLIPLDDAADIEEKQIVGRAARYYAGSGELFINMTYPAVPLMHEQLGREYSQAPDPELMQQMARGLSRNSMINRVGLAVVFALAKRINKEWDEGAMAKALEPESLSLAADNYYESLQDARRTLGKAMKMNRTEADDDETVAV
ncbi:ATP-binding protein [Sandarakinorhabdus sp. DWP1-3-1]|uniref:ATP-binding protein n=1 Tax=Sandarakinorhabdus sp. DWP1-3-1 TaxID=2804627 RepID=UPI003CE7DD73